MMYAGESRLAYRRSNTLRCPCEDGTVCGHTLESPPAGAEGVRMEIQISQAKGQRRNAGFFVCVG